MIDADVSREFTEEEVGELLQKLGQMRQELGKVVIGQRETLESLTVALLAGGHCLLEGVPGLAKTLMVRTLSDVIQLSFQRIQFTPDLMPTDIIGTEILEEEHGTGRRHLRFNRGPIFANLVLADEINRCPPKTQSALLEAMQECAVTYGGRTYPLERPFFVLATQNPIEQSGTFPLPEAQLDRFLLYVKVEYPRKDEELEILASTTGSTTPKVNSVITAQAVLRAQTLVRQVRISRDLLGYVNELVRSTRPELTSVQLVKDSVEWGAGPRGGQALVLAAKARALLEGRFAVTLEDLHRLAAPVLRHRILINFKGQAERLDSDAVTQELLRRVPQPRSPLA
jgi:MoxR-like ATPase